MTPMKNILLLAHGFEEIEAIAPLDLLRRAEIGVTTISIEDTKLVRGAHDIMVETDMLLSELPPDTIPALIILPGGAGHARLDGCGGVHKLLRTAFDNGAYLAAICAAPMILGKDGYLDGLRATCFPGYEKYLRGATVLRGGRYNVISDGRIITAAGAGVALEFGLEIIAALKGYKNADGIARAIQK